MTDHGAETVLRPTPGDGLLARAGDLVLLYQPDPEDVAQQLLHTLETVATSGDDGRGLVRALARLVHDDDRAPAFVAYGPTAGTQARAVLLHGETSVLVATVDGAETQLAGADAVTWVDRILRGVTGVSAALGADPPGPASTKVRLDNGVVTAGGFTVSHGVPAGSTPERPDVVTMPLGDENIHEPKHAVGQEVGEDAQAQAHAAAEDEVEAPPHPLFEPAPAALDAGGAGFDPSPHVDPWDPLAPEIADRLAPPADAEPEAPADPFASAVPPLLPDEPAAGPPPFPVDYDAGPPADESGSAVGPTGQIPRDMPTAQADPGMQPSLGLLVLDDGQNFALDKSYVIGREPEPSDEVVGGRATPVRIQDPDALVSRAHAMVSLSGWDVQVVDLGSANGTFLFTPGAVEWTQLPPHQATPITPGTHFAIGGRVFSYESYPTYEAERW